MKKTSWLELIFTAFVFSVGGFMTGLFGLVADVVLASTGISPSEVLFFSHALLGLALCSLYWHLRNRSAENEQMITLRLDRIGLMKHFLGKALRALAPHVEAIRDPEQKVAIAREVKQIEWALHEVLPRGWDANEKPLPWKQVESMRKPQVSTIVATERTVS